MDNSTLRPPWVPPPPPAPTLTLNQVEAVIAKARMRDDTVEWRSACDEVMDEIRAMFALLQDRGYDE